MHLHNTLIYRRHDMTNNDAASVKNLELTGFQIVALNF